MFVTEHNKQNQLTETQLKQRTFQFVSLPFKT
jgi:hypothetical protein